MKVFRILNKLKDDGIVRFSIICDPAAMRGLVAFGLLVYIDDSEIEEQKKTKKSGSHKILERLYSIISRSKEGRTICVY